MAKRLANLWRKLTSRPPLAEIVLRDEGFEAAAQDGTTRRFVRWTDVREIRTLKDLFTKTDFTRVVPFVFRLLFALVKSASVAAVLGGLLWR